MVIPYSEKEEEFMDEKKLLDIMIEGNRSLYTLLKEHLTKTVSYEIRKISDYRSDLQAVIEVQDQLKQTLLDFQKSMNQLKQGINAVDIPSLGFKMR